MHLLLALLAGCEAVPLPEACADLAPPPLVACFGGDSLAWPGYGTLDVAVGGAVVAVAAGGRPEGCLVDVGNDTFVSGVVLDIEGDDGARYTVGLTVPDLDGTLFAAGDRIALSGTHTFGEFGPDTGAVELARDTGAVVFALAEAGRTEDLPSAAFTLAEGAKRCTEDDECGVYSKYDLYFTHDGETLAIPYATSAALGGVRFVHGGYERQADNQGAVCPDWYVAHVSVAMVNEGA